MAWIESHQELAEHPKRKRLSRLLATSKAETIGLLHMLWWWAMDYAKDGDLSRFTNDDLADACDWSGDVDVFASSLIKSGFITEGRQIHDWHDYAGRLIEKREANAERMRKARAEREQATKGERAKNVQRTCETRVGLPNQTKPYLTIPNQPSLSSSRGEGEKKDDAEQLPFSEPLLDEPDPEDLPEDAPPSWKKDAAFVVFWQSYPGPRRKGAPKAHELWRKYKLGTATLPSVMAALNEDKASPEWVKESGRFIPMPTSWMKLQRWLDDAVPPAPPEDNLLPFTQAVVPPSDPDDRQARYAW